MESRLDDLFQEWGQLGGAVLVAGKRRVEEARPAEQVLAESTALCRHAARLTWVVVDWLRTRVDDLDEQALLDRTRAEGDLSVLGVLCDLANEATPHPKFRHIMVRCVPHPGLEPFFSSVARSPLAARLARENALEVFLRWNYWCEEVRYLSPAKVATRQPARWGGRRLPGPGKRLGRPALDRPGGRRLLALWCTEEEWNRLLQQLPEDTRARYQALAAIVTERAANDNDAQAPRAAGPMR
ncbi:MAG: hypothetical protein WAV79_23480 [Anaerolineae bacterium]